MRATRTLAALDEVGSGDHVLQLLDPADDVWDRSRAFVSDGELFGDKVLIVGPLTRTTAAFAPVVLDPARLNGSLISAVRREAASAEREGYRSLRVLHHVTCDGPPVDAEQLLRSELDLEEFAADSGALVVCAYQCGQESAPAP